MTDDCSDSEDDLRRCSLLIAHTCGQTLGGATPIIELDRCFI